MATIRPTGRGVAAACGVAAFLAAALLFVVQPMFARALLPRLGGAPAAWNACAVFFQFALLAGYACAHAMTRLRAGWPLIAAPLGLAALGLAGTAVGISGLSSPTPGAEVWWILWTATTRLALPVVALAATGPTVQRWLASTDHPHARDPYHLSVAGNAGSLAGLMAYPFVIERTWTLAEQAWWWRAGYAIFVLVMAMAAVVTWRRRAVGVVADALDTSPAPPPSGSRSPLVPLRWMGLSATASCLMLSGTTFLTTDIAPMPLLWLLPLGAFLVTFMIAFARRPPVPHRWALLALPPVAVLGLAVLPLGVARPAALFVAIHLLVVFTGALVCHGELAASRPPASHLTAFYAWSAIGGALGGLVNLLLVPFLFVSLLEYPVSLVLACLWRPLGTRPRPPSIRGTAAWVAGVAALAATGPALVGAGFYARSLPAMVVTLGLPLLLAAAQWTRPVRFALMLGALALLAGEDRSRPLFATRNFFGPVRVVTTTDGRYRQFVHGNSLHGAQAVEESDRLRPLTYYSRSGPMGGVIDALGARLDRARVAVVGLGVGTLAAYATPGQDWTFYEINPAVERVARDRHLFSYLPASPVSVRVVRGDGRLALAREADRAFGLVVVDAFVSDAIPVHLLTLEAVRLYASKLRADGVIAFNISNRYLDLAPVLGAVAGRLGFQGLRGLHRTTDADRERGILDSSWVVLAADPAVLDSLRYDPRWAPLPIDGATRCWTDDFSNVAAALDWR